MSNKVGRGGKLALDPPSLLLWPDQFVTCRGVLMAKKKPSKAKTSKKSSKAKGKRAAQWSVELPPRIDVRVAYGSITEVDASAVVVGVFQGVEDLSSAARAIDQRLGGAITEITQRRMFTGKAGEIFILPAVRHDIRAELVILAGMGRFDRYLRDSNGEFKPAAVLETVAENVARTLVRAKVNDFGMALFGATQEPNPYDGLAHLIKGFLRGVRSTNERNSLRSLTICEIDEVRFEEIKVALGTLRKSPMARGIEVTLEEIALPQRELPDDGQKSVVLLATEEPSEYEDWTKVRFSLLARGGKASRLTATKEISDLDLHRLVDETTDSKFVYAKSTRPLKTYGTKLAKTLLPAKIARALKEVASDRRIVVMHDRGMSRVAWETLCIDDWFPAATAGMSRQYLTDHMPVARWLEQRRYGEKLDLLLIVDPTNDLEGAVKEGDMVEKVARRLSGVNVTRLSGKEATKSRILKELQSGDYDVLHYAGHTAFWPDDPEASGIVCAPHGKKNSVLTGAELGELNELPALVFFDSCESARVGWRAFEEDEESGELELDEEGNPVRQERPDVSLAETFLRGGVANYVGTHWEVSDDAAPEFVKVFYSTLLKGEAIGAAVFNGRQAVRALMYRPERGPAKASESRKDWADYIHFGSPDFVLKFPRGNTTQ